MPNDAQNKAQPKDAKRPHLTLVSSDASGEKDKGELVGFFQAFEDALMKEIEAILSL